MWSDREYMRHVTYQALILISVYIPEAWIQIISLQPQKQKQKQKTYQQKKLYLLSVGDIH